MASHEDDHENTDANRAGDDESEEPADPGQPVLDAPGSAAAQQDATGHVTLPVDESPPIQPPPEEVGEAALRGADEGVDPVPGDPAGRPADIEAAVYESEEPSDLAEDRGVDPITDDAVDAGGQPARGPGGGTAGDGRPAARARAGGPAGRRPGPPRNRRRPASAGGARARRTAAAPPGEDEGPPVGTTGIRRGMVILLSLLSVLAVVLTIVAVNLSRSADRKTATPTTTTVTTRPVATLPDAAFTAFRDDETGFNIRYPSTWERLAVPLREVRLFVTNRAAYSVQIRVQRTEEPTTPENLGNLRTFTDGSVAGEGVQVLKVDPVTINGLIGYRYLYTFVDSSSGIQGAHLHYFLFQGRKMHSIVFQALPTEEFTTAEGIFDQMLQSFRSDPEPPTATSTPQSESTPPGG